MCEGSWLASLIISENRTAELGKWGRWTRDENTAVASPEATREAASRFCPTVLHMPVTLGTTLSDFRVGQLRMLFGQKQGSPALPQAETVLYRNAACVEEQSQVTVESST